MSFYIYHPIPVMEYISKIDPKSVDGLGRLIHYIYAEYKMDCILFKYEFSDGDFLGLAVLYDEVIKKKFNFNEEKLEYVRKKFLKSMQNVAFACNCSEVHVFIYDEKDYRMN